MWKAREDAEKNNVTHEVLQTMVDDACRHARQSEALKYASRATQSAIAADVTAQLSSQWVSTARRALQIVQTVFPNEVKTTVQRSDMRPSNVILDIIIEYMGGNFRYLEGEVSQCWRDYSCLTQLPNGRLVTAQEDRLYLLDPVSAITPLTPVEYVHVEDIVGVSACGHDCDDGRVVVHDDLCTLIVVDTTNGKILLTWSAFYDDQIECVEVLTDGRVATCSYGGYLRVFGNVSIPANFIATAFVDCTGYTIGPRCLRKMPEGRFLSGSPDRTIRIWNPDTGLTDLVLVGHTRSVTSLLMLNDWQVVSGAKDGSLRLWDLRTVVRRHWRNIEEVDSEGEESLQGSVLTVPSTLTLLDHNGRVQCLGLLSDGSVISGANDDKLKIWKMSTGLCKDILLQQEFNEYQGFKAVFGRSDGGVVSMGRNREILLWR